MKLGLEERWRLTGPPLLGLGIALAAFLVSACDSSPARRLSWVEDDARTRAKATTRFQAAMLRDGVVTFAEYKRSTGAVIHCLRTASVPIEVNGPRPAPGGELEFFWAVEAARKDYASANAVARRRFEHCHRNFEDDVKVVYSNQRVIPKAERPAVLNSFGSCLRAAGLKVPQQPAINTLIAIIDADKKQLGKRCVGKYFDVFRLPAR